MAHQQSATEYVWRGCFENTEVQRLHPEAFDHLIIDYDWNRGFVNVAWDGGGYAFILDTMVATNQRRRGLATQLIDRERTKGPRSGLRVVTCGL